MYNINTEENMWKYLQHRRTQAANREILLRNPDILRQVVENRSEQPVSDEIAISGLIVFDEA